RRGKNQLEIPGPVASRPLDLPGARPSALPRAFAPMQAGGTRGAFSDPEWLFEPKLDGVRAIAIVGQGAAKLLSRQDVNMAHQYPQIVRELKAQAEGGIVLDGELVALDEAGRPSFQLLQKRMSAQQPAEIARADAALPAHY